MSTTYFCSHRVLALSTTIDPRSSTTKKVSPSRRHEPGLARMRLTNVAFPLPVFVHYTSISAKSGFRSLAEGEDVSSRAQPCLLVHHCPCIRASPAGGIRCHSWRKGLPGGQCDRSWRSAGNRRQSSEPVRLGPLSLAFFGLGADHPFASTLKQKHIYAHFALCSHVSIHAPGSHRILRWRVALRSAYDAYAADRLPQPCPCSPSPPPNQPPASSAIRLPASAGAPHCFSWSWSLPECQSVLDGQPKFVTLWFFPI